MGNRNDDVTKYEPRDEAWVQLGKRLPRNPKIILQLDDSLMSRGIDQFDWLIVDLDSTVAAVGAIVVAILPEGGSVTRVVRVANDRVELVADGAEPIDFTGCRLYGTVVQVFKNVGGEI